MSQAQLHAPQQLALLQEARATEAALCGKVAPRCCCCCSCCCCGQSCRRPSCACSCCACAHACRRPSCCCCCCSCACLAWHPSCKQQWQCCYARCSYLEGS